MNQLTICTAAQRLDSWHSQASSHKLTRCHGFNPKEDLFLLTGHKLNFCALTLALALHPRNLQKQLSIPVPWPPQGIRRIRNTIRQPPLERRRPRHRKRLTSRIRNQRRLNPRCTGPKPLYNPG